jgi:hypothetical protein
MLLVRGTVVRRRTEYLGGPLVIALALIGTSVLRPGLLLYGQAAFALATAVALAVAYSSERDGARSLAWITAAACWTGHGYHFIAALHAFGTDDWKVTASLVLCCAMLLLPLVGLVLTSRRPPRPGVATAAEAVIVLVVMVEAYWVSGFLSLSFYDGSAPLWSRAVFLFMALPWAVAAWLRSGRRIVYASAALPYVVLAAFPTEVFGYSLLFPDAAIADPTLYLWLAFGLPALGAAVEFALRLRRRERTPEAAEETVSSGTGGEITLPSPEWRE